MQKIAKKLNKVRYTEDVSIPIKIQDYMYFEYARPQDENSRLYRTKASNLDFLAKGHFDQHAEVFFDPARDLADPSVMSVATARGSWSDDGNFWAYSISKSGSDWQTIKVRDARSNKDLPDELNWLKFTQPSWTQDNKGFFYSKFEEPKQESLKNAGMGTEKLSAPKLMYHRLGTK